MRAACILRERDEIEISMRAEERETTGGLVDLERWMVSCGISQRKGDEKEAIKRQI